METRHAADLKKILETIEADKKEMAQKMQAMQGQIQELLISQNHGEDSASSGSVNKRGAGSWHPNDIKVDIPEYDGKLDPDEFVEWLRTVERVFDYKQTTEDNKVKIVALKLRKYASTWWSNTCLKRERAGKEKIQTWPKMKAKMKQKFLPTYYVQNSFSQLHSLRQGTGTAEEYSREFEYLLMKCDVPEDDPQTLVRYLGGLEPRVANVVELHSYQTLTELTLLSHKVDSQQRSKGKFEPTRQSFKPTTYSKPTSTHKTTTPTNSQNPKSEPSKAPRRCFRCQGLGHIASECPNKRMISLADFELAGGFEFESDLVVSPESPHDDEVEVTGPDEGPCLVVRRTLSTTPVVPETQLQRESIFHTRCTIAQKVCSVIIDGGSCTNVASQTLVTKLNLSTQPHPSPYPTCIDVDETFSPVVNLATIRTVLSLALSRHWPVHQLDVKNAFLHGSLSETVYMQRPPRFRDSQHPDHVCHLQRSLYGLKQAPQAWFQRFAAYAARVGFIHSRCDTSLFIYRRGSDTTYLLLYVDDIILTASSTAFLQCIIATLHAEFFMTDLGPLNYFLGISVTRNTSGMFLSQQNYASELLECAGMLTCNPCRTPVGTDSKFSIDGDLVSDPTLYRSLAGALQYLTFTRPRASFLCSQADLAIGLGAPLHVGLPPVIMFFLATIYFRGLQRGKLPFLAPVLKLSIGVLLMPLPKLVGY
ncbi:reverse transcriptase, partial [Tanacetum coccineum]